MHNGWHRLRIVAELEMGNRELGGADGPLGFRTPAETSSLSSRPLSRCKGLWAPHFPLRSTACTPCSPQGSDPRAESLLPEPQKRSSQSPEDRVRLSAPSSMPSNPDKGPALTSLPPKLFHHLECLLPFPHPRASSPSTLCSGVTSPRMSPWFLPGPG